MSAEPTSHQNLIGALRRIVGRRHVLTTPSATARYRQGYRTGAGGALAVARPAGLVELWRAAQACLAAEVAIIMQASNTGLTGGSTPDGDDYPGGVVIISALRIRGFHLINESKQVICLPGATLHALESALARVGREPHSVIGSSCLGASVIGGVCNNSGGSLIRRGPAYTELALYGAVGPDGALRLVNHLGVALGDDPEEMLQRLETGAFRQDDISPSQDKWAHDRDYAAHVRDIDSGTPARFNADPRRLFEAAGSAGRLILFAVRLDTFEAERETTTFYIGCNDPGRLTKLRRTMLGEHQELPVAAEYMHRTAFDVADRYGKDMFLLIQGLGTQRLPAMFAVKSRLDALLARLPLVDRHLSDRLLQGLGRWFPDHLPRRLRGFRDRFEHHLLLKTSKASVTSTRELLSTVFEGDEAGYFECTEQEAKQAFLHRFVAAGAAVRLRALHGDTVEDIVALDVALPRSTQDWLEVLPAQLAADVIHVLYYGHFFCHVFHQDYILRKGVDPVAFEHCLWDLLDARSAEYPAEHNVGHLYKAKPALRRFYRKLDPCNVLNPGIGKTTRRRRWEGADADCPTCGEGCADAGEGELTHGVLSRN